MLLVSIPFVGKEGIVDNRACPVRGSYVSIPVVGKEALENNNYEKDGKTV